MLWWTGDLGRQYVMSVCGILICGNLSGWKGHSGGIEQGSRSGNMEEDLNILYYY